MYISESIESITKSALEETNAKLVPAGSLLLGMYDTAALKASIAVMDCSCNQAIAFSNLDRDSATPIYLYYVISVGREYFRRLQRGVRQKNLNLSIIRELRAPLPPLEMQHEFGERIEEINKLKGCAESHQASIHCLFDALQSKAFRGEL